MASIYKTFATDKALEAKGILVEYDDIRFLVARAGGSNSKFRKVFQAKTKPHRYKIDNDMLSEELAQKLLAEAYAEAVILRVDAKDKDGKWAVNMIPLPDGTLTEATHEAVTNVLLELPLLFTDVQSMANNVSNFRKTEEEADAKKLLEVLNWQLQWGPQLSRLEEMAKAGVEVPALLNRPELTQWSAPYYAGFMLLSGSRPPSMGGVTSIPLSELLALLALYGIEDLDECDTWVRMLRVLDSRYVEFHTDKQAAEQEQAKARAKSTRR